MGYYLNTDQILEALTATEHPRLHIHKQAIEHAVSAAALDLAAVQGVKVGEATFEGEAFGGLCAPFGPAWEGQELPDGLDGYDDRDSWDE